jgi:hypothetical protein
MIIKNADDKTKDIETLSALLEHPEAAADKKKEIEREIKMMRAGIKGEKDAAYEIDFKYGKTRNWVVIHDLRIVHKGRGAQIDHVIINRFLDIWVCKSKRFGEGIAINEHGECSAFFAGKPYGMPSPFEQNKKHVEVLRCLLNDGVVALPKRLGLTIRPDLKSLILVSKNARISRPKAKVDGVEEILKVDQLASRIEKDLNGSSLLAATKAIGQDTLEDLARRLVAEHQPASKDWHARFGLKKPETAPAPTHAAPTVAALVEQPVAKTSKKPKEPAEGLESTQEKGERKSKLVCASCNDAVPYNVAKFCWFNKPKFGGNVYCMECQKTVQPAG